MQNNAHDFSPEDLLERQVREAYLEHDFAQVQSLLQTENFPKDVRETVLTTALRDGNLPLVRFIIDEAQLSLTPERCLMLVFLACQAQRLDIVLYLSEKAVEQGLGSADAYELVFSRFPAERHAAAADELLKRADDRQEALDGMLYAAAAAREFGVIPHLLDLGADPNANGGTVIYLLTTAYLHEYFQDKEKYLSLMQKYLDKFDDRAVLDTALTVCSFKIPDGTQYPEVICMMLDKGADPFGGHSEAQRYLTESLQRLNRPEEAAGWERTFASAQEKDIQSHRRQFELMFKSDFRAADLRQPVNEDGDTGFMLAAKARLLAPVIEAAIREGNAPLKAQDLLAKNQRNQSVLSLALDRGDMPVLLEPAYWSKADAGIIGKVQENLTEQQKPWLDLQRLSAELDQFSLKCQAARFKLRLGPK